MSERLKRYFAKFATHSRSPFKVSPRNALLGFIGAFLTIFLLGSISQATDFVLLMAPFGASCVLAFGVPEFPLSQPRSIIGGHFLTALCGLIVLHFLGDSVLAMAIGTGLGIAVMIMTKTIHPPAGANPIIVITTGASWNFLLTPVLFGALIVVAIAILYNNLIRDRKYPTFWI